MILGRARPPALLALADGTVFRGESFGALRTTTGEVCFNTSLTGYQEVLTDPSYHGQIVTMTAPHIGNTGVNSFDEQSRRPWVAGFVVRDPAPRPSSWRAENDLGSYLDGWNIPGIAGIDTRRLTRHIRTKGAMQGALSGETTDADALVEIARAAPSLVGRDLAGEVSTPEPWTWGPDDLVRRAEGRYAAGLERDPSTRALLSLPAGAPVRKVAAYDFGLKQNIVDLLAASGFEVTVVPATTPAADVLAGGYDGVFLSNGPGDPEPVGYGIDAVRALVGRVPVFGICLGHQILGLALGADTFKLPFGHRGGNHPVRRLGREHVEITCQNHGFAVDAGSIDRTRARLTHVNLNDNTVEGLEVPGVAYSVQYHPESGPGPHDSRYLFLQFRDLIERFEETSLDLPVSSGAS